MNIFSLTASSLWITHMTSSSTTSIDENRTSPSVQSIPPEKQLKRQKSNPWIKIQPYSIDKK
jgi:hypothetical protein